jgi:hypothetical protein
MIRVRSSANVCDKQLFFAVRSTLYIRRLQTLHVLKETALPVLHAFQSFSASLADGNLRCDC